MESVGCVADEGEAMATRNQIASLLDHMADQIFVAADPYEKEWTLAEFRWLCEQSGLTQHLRELNGASHLANDLSPVR